VIRAAPRAALAPLATVRVGLDEVEQQAARLRAGGVPADARFAVGAGLDPVVLTGHFEALETPAQHLLEEGARLSEVFDRQIETAGFHVRPSRTPAQCS